tara:strand:+ start:6534 stop:8729 length:2196 start_codon:yes stop_codon:yes gene_type:complete
MAQKYTGAAPSQRLSQGLNLIAQPVARPINTPLPRLQVPPRNPATDLANSLSQINTKLKQYTQANIDQYKTDADIEVQKVIDERLAAGDSYQKIQQDFANGAFDDTLKMQLHYDSFNTAFGARAWNNFAQTNGKKITNQMMSTLNNEPWEKVTAIKPEVEMAQLSNEFRQMYGQSNLKLLAGAESSMMNWRQQFRDKWAKAYDIRYTTERENTGVQNSLQFLEDTFSFKADVEEVNLETGKTKEYGKVSDKEKVERFTNIATSLNTFLKQYQENTGLGKSSIKTMRLQVSEALINKISHDKEMSSRDRIIYLNAVERILNQSPEKGIPSPITDFSLTKKPDGSSGTEVQAKATQLLSEVSKVRTAMEQAEGVRVTKELVLNNRPVPQKFRKHLAAAGDAVVADIQKKYKNPSEARVALARAAEQFPEKLSFITDKLNYSFANIRDRLASKNETERNKVIGDMYSVLELYKSFSPAARNKYLPTSNINRRILDYLLIKNRQLQQTGVPSAFVSQDTESKQAVHQGFAENLQSIMTIVRNNGGTLPQGKQLTDKDIKEVISDPWWWESTGVAGDITDAGSWWDTGMSSHGKMIIRQEANLLGKMYNLEGLDKAEVLARISQDLKSTLMSVDGDDHIFKIGPTSPFRNPALREFAGDYVKDQLEKISKQYAENIDRDGYDPDDITIMNLSRAGGLTNEYIIVYKNTYRPVKSNAIIVIDEKSVTDFIANKRASS